MLELTKICSRCNAEKFVTEFYSNKKLRSGLQAWCKKCQMKANKKYKSANPEKAKKSRRKFILKRKTEVFGHYGKICSICGSNEKLCIDHINGNTNGEKYRKAEHLWLWLYKNKFPSGFRVLCRSCNFLDGLIRKSAFLSLRGIDDLMELVNNARKNKSVKSKA